MHKLSQACKQVRLKAEFAHLYMYMFLHNNGRTVGRSLIDASPTSPSARRRLPPCPGQILLYTPDSLQNADQI